MRVVAGLAIAATLLATPSRSQEADRYILERSGEGFVRMDRMTGEMSICDDRGGQLACRLAADERAAFENELDALAERVKKLEAQMAGMEKSAATELPSETEFEQTLTLMERFFRRFWDLVREFESEKDQPSPEDGTPQRT